MIDFTSTGQGIDPRTVEAAQQLAAMIASRVIAASEKPTRIESADRESVGQAAEAIEYLFGASEFETHAELIGSSAHSIRRALRSNHELPTRHGFSEARRRVIQLRLTWRATTPAI